MTHDKNEKFPGFPAEPNENFWQYPRSLNGYWHQLSGTEQKVLDYIVRHTWGYRKNADKISLSQFKEGIKNRKTGIWVDKGIGIKKNETILKATQKLENMGFIEIVKTKGKTTEYKLRLLPQSDNPYPQNGLVGSPQNGHTIKDVTINNLQKPFFEKREKPYYRGNSMRYVKDKNKWYVIIKGEWLEYAGKQSEIEWK